MCCQYGNAENSADDMVICGTAVDMSVCLPLVRINHVCISLFYSSPFCGSHVKRTVGCVNAMNYSNSGSNKYFTLVQDDKDSSEPQTPLPPAPALHLDSHRLFVECHHTCKQAVTLTLRNPDTAAVYFTWQPRMPRLHHRKLQVSRAQANKTRAFVLACQSGCILPGEAKLFHFLFAPPSPGMFTECWKLCTQPEASVPGGCEVTLRGTALTHDAGVLKRTQLQQHTSAEQKARQVACAVEHILRGINVPEAIHAPLSQSEWPEVHRFASGTVHIVPPVYFKPGVNKVLEELYTDVRASLVPQVDPKKKGKKAEKAVMPDIPEGFDGRVDTLMQCLEKVRLFQGNALAS